MYFVSSKCLWCLRNLYAYYCVYFFVFVADFEFCAFLSIFQFFIIVTPNNSSEARTCASEASLPPAGARIFRGPVGPLKF